MKLWLENQEKVNMSVTKKCCFGNLIVSIVLFFIPKTDLKHVDLILDPFFFSLQSSWGLKGSSGVGPFGVTMNKHKGAGGFWKGDSGPHADPVYVFKSGFVLSRRCKTPSHWDKRWLMPLNERHFNGPGLLKRFIRLRSDLSTHSARGFLC